MKKEIKLINIEEAKLINKLREEIKRKSEVRFAFKNPKDLWGSEKEIYLENGEIREPKFIHYNNGQSFIWIPISIKRDLTEEELNEKEKELKKLEEQEETLINYIDEIKYNLEDKFNEEKLNLIFKDIKDNNFKYVNYGSQISMANGIAKTSPEYVIETEWDSDNFIIVKTPAGSIAYIPSYQEEPYVYTDPKVVQKLEQLGNIWKTPNCSLVAKEDFKSSLILNILDEYYEN